jgi:O-antigen ligase
MNFLKFFDLRIFTFSFTLWGYGIISFLASDPVTTQLVTVPYRAIVLSLNLCLIVVNFDLIKIKARHRLSTPVKSLANKRISILLVTFIILYSIRVLYDTTGSGSAAENPGTFLLLWFPITLIPAINFLHIDFSKSNTYLIYSWIFLCVIGAGILVLNPSESEQFTSFGGRLSNLALNPIALGHYAASLALLGLFISLNQKTVLSGLLGKFSKIVFPATAAIGVVGVFLSGSRGPFISLIVCTLILFLTSSQKTQMGLKFVVTLVFIAGLFWFGISFALEQGSGSIERIFATEEEFSGTSQYSGTGQSRLYLYSLVLEKVEKHPLFGFGLELPDGFGYPHNLILESFLALGILGGSMFIFLQIYMISQAFGLLKSKNSSKAAWGWVGILFIQYFIASMFSGSIYGSYILWYMMFAVLVIVNTDDVQFSRLEQEHHFLNEPEYRRFTRS